MKRIALLLFAVATVSIIVASADREVGHADDDAALIFGVKIPRGYRDWRLISVAHGEGSLNDIRAILGNDVAMKASREGKLPFPDGTIIARLAWSYDPLEESEKAFGRLQSYVAGPPKNGVQFMIKDSKKYASTGGWGFAQFDDGKPADEAMHQTCFPANRPPKLATLSSTVTHLNTENPVERNETMTTHKSTAASALSRRALFLNGLAMAAVAAFSPATAGAQPSTAQRSAADAIFPFRVNVPQEALDDLRRRLAATRWPDRETVNDQSQGIQLAKLQELVRYWGTGYDWRKVEAKLNALPQFITTIEGVDIHFIHVRSRHKNALPVIISHGWPGSIIEQLKVIGPLTEPTAHVGSAEDAFDVVIPSLPGYGFSGKPTDTGWDPDHIARAWAELMKRLGYTRYVAQGGDWGTPISSAMARQAPPGLLGIHINLPATVPPEVAAALVGGGPAPAGLSEKERAVFEALMTNAKNGNSAYFVMMTARPQTVGYGATDSPAGLGAWILVHPGFAQWAYGADPQKSPTKDDVLDNITLYWLTNTATSAARLYWENGARGSVIVAAAQKTGEISLPVAITVFPEDIYRPPETWARRAYRNLIYFHEVDKGGHFAAWEQPELFAAELRAAFKPLR